MADVGPEWAPVAGQAVGVFGHVSEPVQLAIVAGFTAVAIVMVVAVIWARTRPEADAEVAAMAVVITHLVEEFSRQIASHTTSVERLAEVVEAMRQTIVGCATCAFHPNAKKD